LANTTYDDVVRSFHSSFQEKTVIPETLELEWFKKAVGKFSFEIEIVEFDEALMEFSVKLDRYEIDTMAAMMKKCYQERELSKVNKRISIVGRDLSIDGSNGSKTASRQELIYVSSEVDKMLYNQTPTAYS
jgi:hypothetical protein